MLIIQQRFNLSSPPGVRTLSPSHSFFLSLVGMAAQWTYRHTLQKQSHLTQSTQVAITWTCQPPRGGGGMQHIRSVRHILFPWTTLQSGLSFGDIWDASVSKCQAVACEICSPRSVRHIVSLSELFIHSNCLPCLSKKANPLWAV